MYNHVNQKDQPKKLSGTLWFNPGQNKISLQYREKKAGVIVLGNYNLKLK